MRVALAAVVGMAVTSGCASVEARRYAQTRAVCGLEGTEPITAEAYHDEPTYPSEACVDAILDDLGADREALLAADDLADPYAGVRGEPSLDTVVGTLLGAARALLVTELGDAGGAIGEALADVRAVTGESDAAPLL
ncbi:MAG: hypothetical protein ABMB14_31775, partial [Myxococcota bacterium]